MADEGEGVLLIAGELDLRGAAELRRRLASPPGVAVLDLRQVTFIDAAGLRALESVPSLKLRAPSPPVRRLLDLLDLADTHVIEGQQQGAP